MKIYGNWKLFIITLNIVIVCGLVGMALYSFTQNFELVDKDYYAKGVKYQQQINKINRTNKLSGKVVINPGKDEVAVYFPKLFNFKKVDGNIEFYRPSSASKDFSVPVKLDSIGLQKISFADKAKGFWVVKIDWRENDSAFFHEEEILLR